MKNKLILNKFNCGQKNFSQKAWSIKCSRLPKYNHKECKRALKIIQILKKDNIRRF